MEHHRKELNSLENFGSLTRDDTGEGSVNDDDTQILRCPGCHSELEIDTEYYREIAGTDIACPECDTPLAVPPLDPEPTAAKALGLPSATPPPVHAADDTEGPTQCPTCGADFVEPDAVLCMSCGTNRLTGEQMASLASTPRKTPGKTRTTPREALTGVIAVMVILVCAVRGYVLYTQKQRTEQSEILAAVMNSTQESLDYAESVELLESSLQKTPRAVNRPDAEDLLEDARRNLAELPARTQALREAMARAREETDRAEAIRTLNAALKENPGTKITDEAQDLLAQLRDAK